MWNYNLDEMPKDGSEIVVCVKFKNYDGNELTMFYTIKFVFGFWQNYPSQTKWKHMDKVFCWVLAPEKPENDGVEKLIDWFDHWFDYVYPSIAKDYSVPYWKGLRAIRDRIELELSQSGCKEPKMTDKPCVACCMYHYDDGESVCLMCGRFQGKANG